MKNNPISTSKIPPSLYRREKPRNQLLKVVTNDRQWCSLPMGIVNVFNRETRQPSSLFELTLRKFYTTFWGYILEHYMINYLPRVIFEYIRNGPIGHCNNLYCVTPLFRECYFCVLRRQNGPVKYTYSAIFCAKDCAEMWLWQNNSIYKDVEWNLEQDD